MRYKDSVVYLILAIWIIFGIGMSVKAFKLQRQLDVAKSALVNMIAEKIQAVQQAATDEEPKP